MEVREGEDGTQQIQLETQMEGKLILHWGVERQDKDGWALPNDGCWPPGTVAYKKRALQTPWRCTATHHEAGSSALQALVTVWDNCYSRAPVQS